MSIERRFRIWDHIHKEFANPEKFLMIANTGEVMASCTGEYTIQQYTGLKDKNGKGIYEGDIVIWKHPMEDVGVVNFGNSSPNMSVFYLDVKRLGECLFQDDDIYEVIGNIFENPELLK